MAALLYFLTIIFFAIGQVGRFAYKGGLAFQLIDAFVVLTVSAWLITKLRKREIHKLYHHDIIKSIAIFVGIAFFSLVLNPYRVQGFELALSAMYLFRWVCYSFLFLVVNDFSPSLKRNAFIALICSGVIMVIIGFIQYAFYPNLRNLFYLGWDDHLYRLFSVFFDPNFAATIFSLILFALLPVAIGNKMSYFKNVLLARSIFIITFIALLLTYSRSGYLMFAIGMVTSLWLLGKRKLIIVLIAVLLFGIGIIPKDLGSSGVELWRTASIFARTQAAEQAIAIFLDHPFLGVGFNTFRYTQREYGFESNQTWEMSHSGAGTDNSFLFVLATTGIVGFVAYLYLWFQLFRKAYQSYKNGNTSVGRQVGIILLASSVGLFVNALFINSLFYPHVLFWFWSMFGLMESKSL